MHAALDAMLRCFVALAFAVHVQTADQFTRVTTAEEFAQAVADGAAHIRVEQHLDLRSLTLDNLCPNGECSNLLVFRLKPETESIQGDCPDAVPEAIAQAAATPALVPQKPGQCIVLTKDRLFQFAGPDAATEFGRIWVDNLYVRLVWPANNPDVKHVNLMGANADRIWFTNVTFQGADTGQHAMRAVDPWEQAHLYFGDCMFSDLKDTDGPVAAPRMQSTCFFDGCSFRTIDGEDKGAIYILSEARSTVRLENVESRTNITGYFLALHDENAGTFITDKTITVLHWAGQIERSTNIANDQNAALTPDPDNEWYTSLRQHLGKPDPLHPARAPAERDAAATSTSRQAGTDTTPVTAGSERDDSGDDDGLASGAIAAIIVAIVVAVVVAALVLAGLLYRKRRSQVKQSRSGDDSDVSSAVKGNGVESTVASSKLTSTHSASAGGMLQHQQASLAVKSEAAGSPTRSAGGHRPHTPAGGFRTTSTHDGLTTTSGARYTTDVTDESLCATLPASEQRAGLGSSPAMRKCTDVEDALDQLRALDLAFFGKYIVLGPVDRRVGGQGLVQFMRGKHDGANYAAKFYTNHEAFASELELYMDPTLQKLMPARHEVLANEDGRLCTPSGYVFPPCIILERGESLDEFARNVEYEFITVMQALSVVAGKLATLHAAGFVHRDLKPGNVLRMPAVHSWTLIDFGCSARRGEMARLMFSIGYAAPEVVHALERGEHHILADPAMDMWAVGAIAFELLTNTPVFEYGTSKQAALDIIAGRGKFPWEGEQAPELLHMLRRLKGTILSCLDRDPMRRPSAAALVSSWNHFFDVTGTQMTYTTSSSTTTGYSEAATGGLTAGYSGAASGV